MRGASQPSSTVGDGKVLSRREVRRLLLSCRDGSDEGARDLALVSLVLATGAEPLELAAALVADLTLPNRRYVVRGAHGRAQGVAWLPRWCVLAVEAHLARRGRRSGPLFLAPAGRGVGGDEVEMALQRRAAACGLDCGWEALKLTSAVLEVDDSVYNWAALELGPVDGARMPPQRRRMPWAGELKTGGWTSWYGELETGGWTVRSGHERELLREMVAAGCPNVQIATTLHWPSGEVTAVRREMGLGDSHFKWSAERKAELAALAAQGLSNAQIGELLGMTAGSVGRQIRRTGLTSPRAWSWPAGELADLLDAGLSVREAAGAMDRSLTSVKRQLNRMGLASWVGLTGEAVRLADAARRGANPEAALGVEQAAALEVLAKNAARHAAIWTAERDDELRSLFSIGLNDEAIGEAMGCSAKGIQRQRRRLGLLWPNLKRWTVEDEDHLRVLFEGGLSDGAIVEGMGRTVAAVASRRVRLRLMRRHQGAGRWTAKDEDQLRVLFDGGGGDGEIAIALGRTAMAIVDRRHRLGLSRWPWGWSQDADSRLHRGLRRTRSGAWSQEQERHLRDLVEVGVKDVAIGAVLGRSESAVASRRKLLHLRRTGVWDEAKRAELGALFDSGLNDRGIGVAMGLSRSAISTRRWKLGLRRAQGQQWNAQAWTPERTAELGVLFDRGLSDGEIGAAMGRSVQAIQQRRGKLRLVRSPAGWTAERTAELRLLFDRGLTDQQIGAAMGRGIEAIQKKRSRLRLVRVGWWTAERTAELRLLVDRGLSDGEIGAAMGRSVRTILVRRLKLDLLRRRPRGWTEKELAELRALFDRDLSDRKIGVALDRNHSAIRMQRIKLHLLPRRPRRWTEKEVAALRELVDSGLNDRGIGAAMGLSRDAIWRQRKQLGLLRREGRPVPGPAADQ